MPADTRATGHPSTPRSSASGRSGPGPSAPDRSASGPSAERLTADPPRTAVAAWVLREQRRSLVLWAIALSAVSAMYLAFWPTLGTNAEMEAMVQNLPEAMVTAMGWDRIGSAPGYLESTIYALIAPVLLLVFGISAGARLLAGEEETGTLELEVSAPIDRRQVLVQRFAALTIQLALLCLALGAVTVAMVLALDMEVTVGNILAAVLGLWLFVLAMSAIAFAAGAATGRRSVALATGAGVAVVSYLANTLAPMVQGGDWMHRISPFSWFLEGDPLVEGVAPAGYGALLALIALAVVIALVRFDRRDLGV